ncbi:Naringenin-chalcone synthase (plasmid) [Deinococcus proteolyticus MRP]|uniref:Naringenin-chalcone synthase n=1 Tax=Deinococcus proteolyticus (strain ATCC 35074 / DSM 20540 / JCM 6276 / NBRC 101906 / NCIMB 13154 / VKM Ac-1939 / CCM 2703 / MRP) TaxID=693977 RepID=F0RPG6_DEIPM|nr:MULTISPECIES: 3-oxoacyl-[acyl-carrier-protein] synthase III C-terminal domain-containing protein [Deinococcus]ADY27272.1 Naringenin-chalcone synthase [Deinococcus proteolyticus MRP]MCY1704141.1 type III polyketide synthase [Deinococcus sp. SL84]
MSAYLLATGTAVPPHVYPQDMVRDMIKNQARLGRLARRLVPAAFNASGIDQRHSVIGDYRPGSGGGAFYDEATGEMLTPSTGARNAVYVREATPLFVEAGRRALEASGLGAGDITHVVTVSCTGFFAPGPDYMVVRQLGLRPTTGRYHVGFMGCYAAFPALKMAKAFCDADPEAAVMVICTELCTLHVNPGDDPDSILSSTVFADGAAAAVVSGRPPQAGRQALRLDAFETTLTPPGEGEKDMAWSVGDQGYEMVLSSYVPDIIENHLHGALGPLLLNLAAELHASGAEVEHWAVHPGGRAILDKVQGSLGLSEEQMRPSREVLREYGNMSSATVLFIIGRLLDTAQPGERACAMAFGPGLTVESGLMTAVLGE